MLTHEQIIKTDYSVNNGTVYCKKESNSKYRKDGQLDTLLINARAMYLGLDSAAYLINDVLDCVSRSNALSMELPPQLILNAKGFIDITLKTLACARGEPEPAIVYPEAYNTLFKSAITSNEQATSKPQGDKPVGTTLKPHEMQTMLEYMAADEPILAPHEPQLVKTPERFLPLTLMNNTDLTNVVQVDTRLWKRKRA